MASIYICKSCKFEEKKHEKKEVETPSPDSIHTVTEGNVEQFNLDNTTNLMSIARKLIINVHC